MVNVVCATKCEFVDSLAFESRLVWLLLLRLGGVGAEVVFALVVVGPRSPLVVVVIVVVIVGVVVGLVAFSFVVVVVVVVVAIVVVVVVVVGLVIVVIVVVVVVFAIPFVVVVGWASFCRV